MSAIRYTGNCYTITQSFYDRVDVSYTDDRPDEHYDSIDDAVEDMNENKVFDYCEYEMDEILAVFSDPHFDDPKALAADDRRDRMKDGEQ